MPGRWGRAGGHEHGWGLRMVKLESPGDAMFQGLPQEGSAARSTAAPHVTHCSADCGPAACCPHCKGSRVAECRARRSVTPCHQCGGSNIRWSHVLAQDAARDACRACRLPLAGSTHHQSGAGGRQKGLDVGKTCWIDMRALGDRFRPLGHAACMGLDAGALAAWTTRCGC